MRAMRLFVALAVAAMVATSDGSAVASGAGMAFEDRNNNGVFDAGDRDITAEIIESSVFVTTESVVFVGKTLQSPKTGVYQRIYRSGRQEHHDRRKPERGRIRIHASHDGREHFRR